ncbi:MAG: tetratricopeptide repeat protein [Bacteroidota bacterium]|nr:tetratricopeptide repeat protein [Rhodothermia bacterium]MDW8137280.1 tetratricopeptide repeat protein [Bacteroidota bacterium]
MLGGLVLLGFGGCSGDPNVEGAKLNLRQQDYAKALENLDKALQKNPQNAEAWRLKAQTLVELARREQDFNKHFELATQAKEALDKAKELILQDPKAAGLKQEVDNLYKIAWAYEFNRAAQAFQRGSADNREPFIEAAQGFELAAMWQPDSTVNYINAAYAYINAQRPEKAIAPLERALQKGEKDPQLLMLLAELYVTGGRVEDAIQFLKAQRERNPDNADLLTALLNVYIRADRVHEAVDLFADAVRRNPQNAVYRYNYGTLLLQMDRYEDAIRELSEALRLDPNYENAYYNLGAAYQNQAAELFRQAEDLESEARNKLREELAKPRLTERQRRAAEQAFDEQAKKAEALRQQADELLRKALPYLERAHRFKPEDEGICLALFRAYARLNMLDKAKEMAKCAKVDIENLEGGRNN